MGQQDGFRRRGYRVAMVLLLAATFVGLVGKLWAATTLVLLAMALVGAVEELNDVVMRRASDASPLTPASAAGGA